MGMFCGWKVLGCVKTNELQMDDGWMDGKMGGGMERLRDYGIDGGIKVSPGKEGFRVDV